MTSRSSAVPRGPDRIPASAGKDAIGVLAGGARAGLPQSRCLGSAVGVVCRCDCLKGGNQLDVLAEPTRDHGLVRPSSWRQTHGEGQLTIPQGRSMSNIELLPAVERQRDAFFVPNEVISDQILRCRPIYTSSMSSCWPPRVAPTPATKPPRCSAGPDLVRVCHRAAGQDRAHRASGSVDRAAGRAVSAPENRALGLRG